MFCRLWFRFKRGWYRARRVLAIFGLVVSLLICSAFCALNVSAADSDLVTLPEYQTMSGVGYAYAAVLKSSGYQYSGIGDAPNADYLINVFNYDNNNKSMYVDFDLPFTIPAGYTLQIDFTGRTYATESGTLGSNHTAEYNYAYLQEELSDDTSKTPVRLKKFSSSVDGYYSYHSVTYLNESGSNQIYSIRFGIPNSFYEKYGVGARGIRIYAGIRYRLLSPEQLQMYNESENAKKIIAGIKDIFKERTEEITEGWDGDPTDIDGDNTGDLADREDALKGQQQSGLNEITNMWGSIGSIFGDNLGAFNAVGAMLNDLFSISLFGNLIVFGLSIGVIGLFVNLAPAVGRAYVRSQEKKSGKSKGDSDG